MARARNIKPGYFKNEELAECSPWARLAFAGLWTLADREGRLEDRPKRIKGELFPYDDLVVEDLLCELASRSFIDRYSVDGVALIQITNFAKHQTPHHRESPSALPPMPSLGPALGANWVEPKASSKPALDESGSSPSDSLIPDSLFPESSVADATAVAAQQLAPQPGSPAPGPRPMSAKQRAFELGRALLGKDAGPLLGKWAKTFGDDLLAECLADAAVEEPHEPRAWMAKALAAADARRRRIGQQVSSVDEWPAWLAATGFTSVWEAQSAGCGPGNAAHFREGRRVLA